MSVLAYLGFVVLSVVVAVGVRWFQPAVVARLARQSGVAGSWGWAAFVVVVLWLFLPVLFGAGVGEGKLWVVGAAIAGAGAYFLAVAARSLDEYRLLAGLEHRDPSQVTAGEPVATSGVPTVPSDDDASTPFTGVPAVYADWLVQRRGRVGIRRTWTAVDGGVETVPFTLGDGRVSVPAGPDRVVSNAEAISSVQPDDPVPDPAAAFCREHPSLPDPDDRADPLRFLETFVPADEPVTVVGTPRQADEPGSLVVDPASDGALPASDGDGGGAVVLVNGDADAAEATLRKRVFGLGIVGAAMLLGGQALAFALSAATLSTPALV